MAECRWVTRLWIPERHSRYRPRWTQERHIETSITPNRGLTRTSSQIPKKLWDINIQRAAKKLHFASDRMIQIEIECWHTGLLWLVELGWCGPVDKKVTSWMVRACLMFQVSEAFLLPPRGGHWAVTALVGSLLLILGSWLSILCTTLLASCPSALSLGRCSLPRTHFGAPKPLISSKSGSWPTHPWNRC